MLTALLLVCAVVSVSLQAAGDVCQGRRSAAERKQAGSGPLAGGGRGTGRAERAVARGRLDGPYAQELPGGTVSRLLTAVVQRWMHMT